MHTFGFYFKKGLALTKAALKGKSFFTKVLLGLYLVISSISKLFLFLRPVFLIADNNLATMIVEGHDFEISKIFEGVNSRRRYSSLLLSSLFIEGIILAAAVLFIVPFVVWQMTPGSYSLFLQPSIFMIIMSVLVAVLSVGLIVYYSPVGYVTAKGKDLNAGDILFLAKEGSKGIKGKIIGLNIVMILIILGISLIPAAGIYVLLLLIPGSTDEFVLAFTIGIGLIYIAIGFIEIFVISFFRLSRIVSLFSLYFDSVETKHIVVSTKGDKEEEYQPLFADDKEEE